MTWRISWRDSKENIHQVSYSNTMAVFRHVEHCLNQGWEICGIYHVLGKGDYDRCIFPKKEKVFKMKSEWVLDALKRCGPLTPVRIADRVGYEHNIAIHEQTVRSTLYRLEDVKVERVPDTKPIKWRLKE